MPPVRRNAPLLAAHTGAGKGSSTAAFGMALRAWNEGFKIAVFQFVAHRAPSGRSARKPRFAEPGRVHDEHGVGGPGEWHKMGAGAGPGAAQARHRCSTMRRPPPTVGLRSPACWPSSGTTSMSSRRLEGAAAEVGLGPHQRGDRGAPTSRPGTQHVVITGARMRPQPLLDAADLVTEMTKVKHPMDVGPAGAQRRGIQR